MAMDLTVSVATLTDNRGNACKRAGIFVLLQAGSAPSVLLSALQPVSTRNQHARLLCVAPWFLAMECMSASHVRGSAQ
jgi:hypothetical protein